MKLSNTDYKFGRTIIHLISPIDHLYLIWMESNKVMFYLSFFNDRQWQWYSRWRVLLLSNIGLREPTEVRGMGNFSTYN